ncbi:MAG: AraC family transcriptional regulator [Opitutaceae bacterium]|nr:AraC family transcriptional regulator [Opitutaceae bacterium]
MPSASAFRPITPAPPGVQWTPSRQLHFSVRGKYELDLPADCPVRLLWCEFSGDYQVSPSYHDFLEVMQIMEGTGRYVVENRCHRIVPGDVLLVGSGEFHRIETASRSVLRVAALHFAREFIHRPGAAPLELEYLRPFQYRSANFVHRIEARALDARLVAERMGRIERALRSSHPSRPLAVRTFLADILLEITQARDWDSEATLSLGRRARDLARLRPVFELAQRRSDQRLSLRELAGCAHLSAAHFCRLFRGVVGCTFSEYLRWIRIDNAAELLTGSDRTVADIALATGFASQSHFNRAFKQLKGVSPAVYARRMR